MAQVLLLVAALAAVQVLPEQSASVVSVRAIAETPPLLMDGDAADDPAIWLNSQDPAASLIIGTNKKVGLETYDLNGRLVQQLHDGRMNNVDVVSEAADYSGEKIDLVFATNRSDDTIAAYRVDPAKRTLNPLPGGPFVLGLKEAYGLCGFLDPASGEPRVLAGNKTGTVRLFRVFPAADGRWKHEMIREFHVGGQVEGMAVDVEHHCMYIGEETVGVWRYPLDEGSELPRKLLDVIGLKGARCEGHLAPDVEGITIYHVPAANGQPSMEGWILVSCQGEDRFAVYNRQDGGFVGSFRVELSDSGKIIDPVTHTDGLTVLAAPLGPAFPRGLLVVQDDNSGSRQNFKLVDWRDVEQNLRLSSGR